ncbi:hypothetical protein CSKR_105188 [Clonorchis sinensis]|uniref:Uncharacterized protein n=1 Tax=Clonorchis sinensis TaxID=79923 RepID=A0A8T1M0G6_CLOSI|nr:hypothetical protein CSKR_105188 [Clonorchis sinensis]
MLMKTNLFKQFRKDTEMLKASAATERTFSRAPVKETLLWGGLDDTSGSNSCDMDEEDDYFPSNSFMLESSNSLTDSLHDCEWPKRNNTPTNFSKLTTNIRMRVASFPQRDVQAAQLDANLSGIQKSPPPSKRPAASASPMVKFLKNFKEEDKLRSPDTVGKVDEDVTSPCIQSDVSSTEPGTPDHRSPIINTHNDEKLELENVHDDTKLVMLYKTLKSELDRTRRWKVAAELTLNEKNTELSRAESTIENLRKSNLELQMNLENVSLKYKNELEIRNKIGEKMISVERMTTCLRDKFSRVNEMKNEVCENNTDMKQKYFELKNLYEILHKDLTQHSTHCTRQREALEEKAKENFEYIKNLETEIEKYKEIMDTVFEQHNTERQQMDKELMCLMREIDFLSTETVEQKIINSKLINDSTRDREYIEKKEQYIRVLEEAKKFLEEQLEEQTRRLLDAEKKLEVAERLLGEKESEIAKSRELNEEKTLQINILTTELSNLQDEVKLAQSELGEFRQQATLEKSILKENIQVLKSEVMDVLKLLKERDGVNATTENTICDIKNEIILLTEIKKLDEANLMRQVEEITQLKQELRDVLNAKSDLKTKHDDIWIKFHEAKAECEHLRIKEERMEQQLQTEKSSVAKSVLKKEETETKLRAANEELRLLQNRLLQNEEEVKQLKTNCRDYLKQNQELQVANEDEKRNKELAEQKVASLTKTIKDKEEEIRHLSNRVTALDKAMESGTTKTSQLCQNISDLTLQLEYARQELTAQRMKEKSLQDQISKKDHEKSELMDKNDRAIRELSEKHEKLRLQLEEQIQRKTEELATMQKMLDAKRNDSTIGTKRAEKKLSDATNHIEKLKSQLKELNAEKKELAKKLSAQEQEMSSMEKELKEQKHQQELREKEHEELVSIVEKLNAQLELNNQKMMTSEKEIARLQKTESEFKEFQRQLYMNSPPASTQLPPDISATVTQTPKSPALSLRLNSMTIMKTPQKTPRSILKQPGSACKRRRVLFAQPSDNKISNTVSVTDIDSDDGLLSQDLLEATPPCPNKTPDIRSKSIQSLERTSNIRKTPCKKGPTFSESKSKSSSVKTSVNWFESDQLFGMGLED